MRAVLNVGGQSVPERELGMVLSRVSAAMMQEGLALCGREGQIVYVNDNLCSMLGRTREKMIGKPAAQFLGDMHARSLLSVAHRDPRTPSDWHEAELVTSDGNSIVVHAAIHCLEDRRGRHQGCFLIFTDITARAMAEAALRRSESDLRLLSAQLLSAQELERQRIARELHDGIGQAMGGIKFELETCAEGIAAKACSRTGETLRELAGKMQAVVEEVRRIAMNLRPSTLDDLGILPTIGWFCREFRNVYQQYEIATMIDVDEDEISAPVKTAIYRIVQEAFNNVVTHSGARKVSLELKSENGHIELRVRDDGIGFEPKRFAVLDDQARGLGMASMRERAEATGGRFRLDSVAGQGTTVSASWPGRGALQRATSQKS